MTTMNSFFETNQTKCTKIIIEMKIVFLASFFPPKRGLIEVGLMQVEVSHFYEKFSILLDTTVFSLKKFEIP